MWNEDHIDAICIWVILLKKSRLRVGGGARGGRVKIMYSFDKVYQNTAHWLLLHSKVVMKFPSVIVDPYLYIIGLLTCKYEPFTREISEVSLILKWPKRPVWLLYVSICQFHVGHLKIVNKIFLIILHYSTIS